MNVKLDWKWIGIGVLIMLALTVAAGFIIGIFLGSQQEGVTKPEELTLSGSQMAALAIINFLVFVIGGFIVGIKSAGRTILEPGISAALAVLIGLIISGNFSIGNLIVGGIIPFAAGVLGGWFGERKQGTTA